jgi:DNA-binding transcriptional ArsR family regulator
MSKALSTNRMGEQMSEENCSTSSATQASHQPWVSSDQAEVHFILERASRFFSLLAEPARLRILQAVCDKECSVQEIVGQTSLPQPNVSRHLSLLFNAGVLSRRREGTFVFYKVADPLVTQLCRTVCVHLATSALAEPPVV